MKVRVRGSVLEETIVEFWLENDGDEVVLMARDANDSGAFEYTVASINSGGMRLIGGVFIGKDFPSDKDGYLLVEKEE